MIINVTGGEMSEKEKQYYLDYLKKEHPGRDFTKVDLKIDGDYIDISYEFDNIPFERIRRITGYLVGTLDRWNDAKREEEKARLKHNI